MQARLRIAMARKSRMKFNNFPRSGSLCYKSALMGGKIVQTECNQACLNCRGAAYLI